MAKKSKTVWVCQECGYESPKWIGRCICGAWGSMVEEKIMSAPTDDMRRRGGSATDNGKKNKARPLSKVTSAEHIRMSTGFRELDRVLGGGLVPGSLTLISGEPGIGKSTLIIQAAARIADQGKMVLYVSGEESESQIKMRADRVCPGFSESLMILSETNLEVIVEVCAQINPDFLIVDSIQTMYTQTMESAPGSVSQVRTCGNILMKLGKTGRLPIFIVAHVTKSGELAGPKIVEHLVDTVMHFSGERDHEVRILRAFKNRFGTTNEIGAFTMEHEGLVEIENLSASFLENDGNSEEGSVTTAIYEGSRPVLLEVQALTGRTNSGFPRRTAVGADPQRLNMILAVLEKKMGIKLYDRDVYVNIVGGLKPDSTAVDLGVALAVFSSLRGTVPSENTIAIGEVGLTGALRSVQNAEKIAKEAARLGYARIIMPRRNADKILDGIPVIGVSNIAQAAREFSK